MPTPQEITTPKEKIGASDSRGPLTSPPASHTLNPNEPRAPISILTPAKRDALIACLISGGTLHKQRGVWFQHLPAPARST